MEKYIKKSTRTGREYDLFNCVRIKNLKQAGMYMLHNVDPVDIEVERNENGDPKIIWLFNKDETYDVYDKWCKYELL